MEGGVGRKRKHGVACVRGGDSGGGYDGLMDCWVAGLLASCFGTRCYGNMADMYEISLTD